PGPGKLEPAQRRAGEDRAERRERCPRSTPARLGIAHRLQNTPEMREDFIWPARPVGCDAIPGIHRKENPQCRTSASGSMSARPRRWRTRISRATAWTSAGWTTPSSTEGVWTSAGSTWRGWRTARWAPAETDRGGTLASQFVRLRGRHHRWPAPVAHLA